MIIRVKNADTEINTWGGKEFQPNEVYSVQLADYPSFVTSAVFFSAVGNGKALVGDADTFFTDPIEGWEYLEHQSDGEVKVVAMPDPAPFATPTYRTKRNATSSYITVAPGASGTIDFQLTAERYASGGAVIIENAEFGDYCTAEVRDIDGVIPQQYRNALCEAHPVVATYIEKEFIKVGTPGSVQAGHVSFHEMNTYPLNAKITAGLYLRVTYNAVNSGLSRRIVVNYYLTKKL